MGRAGKPVGGGRGGDPRFAIGICRDCGGQVRSEERRHVLGAPGSPAGLLALLGPADPRL